MPKIQKTGGCMIKKEYVKKAFAFFPYYINTDRLIDISASLTKGYAEYEEVSIERELSKNKSKSLKGQYSNKLFTIDAGLESDIVNGSKETATCKRTHTAASLLNGVMESLCKQKQIVSLSDLSGEENKKPTIASKSECGDIVILTGNLALTESSRHLREGDEIESPTEKGNRNYRMKREREETIKSVEETMASVGKRKRRFRFISFLLAVTTVALPLYIKSRESLNLNLYTFSLLSLCALLAYINFSIKKEHRNLQTHTAVKEIQKKKANTSKVVIRTGEYDFICYLQDRYFYKCNLSDIITKRIKCFGIVHEPSSQSQLIAEVEVIALYL